MRDGSRTDQIARAFIGGDMRQGLKRMSPHTRECNAGTVDAGVCSRLLEHLTIAHVNYRYAPRHPGFTK